MGVYNVTLPPPLKGESPYVSVTTPYIDASVDPYVRFNGGYKKPGRDPKQENVWEIVRGNIWLQTSAVVGNRYIYFKMLDYSPDDVAGGIPVSIKTPAIPASTSSRLWLWPIFQVASGVLPSDMTANYGWYVGWNSKDAILRGPDESTVTIVGGEAGDLYICKFMFKYLNHELGIK